MAVTLTCTGLLNASSPKFFQAATQADFLKGEVEGLAIDNRGRLTLGPATDLVYETASPFLWTILPAPDGSLFVGAGNDGRVFRVDAQGRGSLFFDAAELEAHALALAPSGGIYVASSPDGKVYKVDRAGKATVFFDPDDKYIWALATDGKGNLYAGTGEKGIVYKIAPDGTGAPFYETKATHATALAFDKSDNLLVGTEAPGRVFRVDASGKGFLLLDSPFQEIRRLRFDDKGVLYVAAVNGRPPSGGPPPVQTDSGGLDRPTSEPRTPVPTVSVSTEITAISVVDTSGGGAASSRDDRRSPRGAVYRISADGLWDQLWQFREDSPYDIAFDAGGHLIVATGNKGKIFRLEGDPIQPTLLARAAAQQVTALHKDSSGRLYYSTANPGKLYRLSSGRTNKGSYESEPRDAQMVSTWGTVSWRGTTNGGTIEISTRAGNTETPDDTWSAWSPPYTSAEGSAISSPKARYLQWRAVLTGGGEGPVLTSVTAAYLQRNLRPQVRSITVHPPGIVYQKPYGTGDPDLAGFDNQTTPDRKLAQAAQNAQQGGSGSPSLGRRTYHKGLQTIMWRADDENDDELTFEVQYRREGETTWKVLRKDLQEPILVWDTTTVPNGTYFVKIVASDARSNAAGNALTGGLESATFEIDNTPPEFRIGSVRLDGPRTVVTFDVTDDHSPIQMVEYSGDGQRWVPVFPTDGIADSRTEHYVVTLVDPVGPRGLTLRATDSMNNVATTQVSAPSGR